MALIRFPDPAWSTTFPPSISDSSSRCSPHTSIASNDVRKRWSIVARQMQWCIRHHPEYASRIVDELAEVLEWPLCE